MSPRLRTPNGVTINVSAAQAKTLGYPTVASIERKAATDQQTAEAALKAAAENVLEDDKADGGGEDQTEGQTEAEATEETGETPESDETDAKGEPEADEKPATRGRGRRK